MTTWIGEHADLVTLSGEGRPYSVPTPDPLTPKQQSQAAVSAIAKLIAIGCALCTFALLILTTLIAYRLHHILTTWPHTQAEVQTSEIYSQTIDTYRRHQPYATNIVYGFRCTVAYSVASHPYASQADIGYQKGNTIEMTEWHDRIPPGSNIEIAYNPADPTTIHFAAPFPTAYAPALLLVNYIAGLTALGALMLVVSRKLRLPPPIDNR
jgi:hypothetical protein